MRKTAILIDGGFYKKQAIGLKARYPDFWGFKSPKERVNEIEKYCAQHLQDTDNGVQRDLYRIFYYDCPPVSKSCRCFPISL